MRLSNNITCAPNLLLARVVSFLYHWVAVVVLRASACDAFSSLSTSTIANQQLQLSCGRRAVGGSMPLIRCSRINRNPAGELRLATGDQEEELSSRPSDDSSHTTTTTTTMLGLLSFDLDDTLFATSETVRDANEAQIAHMNDVLLSFQKEEDAAATATELLLSVPDFLQTTREIRQALEEPVTYTTLRKMAIRHVLQERLLPLLDGSADGALLERLTNEAFDVWLDERHKAAERHVFPDAVSSLQRLKERFPDACVAAITNGRGDPLEMTETLASFFDFCVSGEDDGVFPNRKPHAGIYEVALQRYRELHPDHHQQHKEEHNATTCIWCHVGDCLANDVGASSDCGAFAVWYSPDGLLEDEQQPAVATAASCFQSGKEPSWSTASKADIAKRKELADQAQEKVATRISSLSELEFAIEELLQASA